MKYGKSWILLLTAALTALILLLSVLEPETSLTEKVPVVPLSAQVQAVGKTETIACWKKGEDRYYLFLPSFADHGNAELKQEPGADVRIDGQPLVSGQTCAALIPGQDYELEYTVQGQRHRGTLKLLCSSGLPSVHIRTQSGNMNYIHQEKGNKESGSIHLYHADGTLSYNGNLSAISGRGNGTWSLDKKPYSLTLTAAADLLGMGEADRWVLLANYTDDSHLRNKMVYDFAADVGMPYAAQSRWVDLYLNGEYAGMYQLSERNEIHPQRVALEENNSFLVSLEWVWRLEAQEYPHYTLDSGFAMRIHHSSMEHEQLRMLWQSAENAILSEDGIDPVTGKDWTQLIDVDSWARKYLMEEIFGSLDAGAVSQYFYGDGETGMIYAGPVWDFDLACGNREMWQLQRPQAFFADRDRVSAWLQSSWYHGLCQKEGFLQRVTDLYREEYRPLLAQYLTENLDAYTEEIQDAVILNQVRWRGIPVEEETAYIRDYLMQRMAFLDSLWLEGETWYRILVDTDDGANTVCYAVRPGETIPQLPEIAGGIGWYHRDTEEPVDLQQPVTENLDIYLRYQE